MERDLKEKLWGDKRYNNLNYHLRNKFGEKVFKICLDGGFTCPNRDGKISSDGCIFCNEKGAGDFAGDREKAIKKQAEDQIELVREKWGAKKYIAYFQNFTNTYADIKKLKKLYEEALEINGVVGLAIATRADCLDKEVIELLSEFSKKTYLWIELGLQTSNENTAKIINRGYENVVFEKVVYKLSEEKIETVVHTIAGLPGENQEVFLETIRYINMLPISGIKIHMLNILKNTGIEKYYDKNPFAILSFEEYIDLIVQTVGILREDIVIHRITGDGNKEELLYPKWICNKKAVLNEINKKLKEKKIFQAKNFDKLATRS